MLKRTGLSWTRIAVAAAVLVVLAAGTHALALTAPVDGGTRGQTILDPFNLTPVSVSALAEGQSLNLRGSRTAIQIPRRPPQRSAFRPWY